MSTTTMKERTPLETWLPRLAVPWATSLLLWMCYFPLAWGFLAWGALVPLLCLLRQERSTRSLLGLSYLAGLVFFLSILQWMRVADWRMNFAWLALCLYCAVYFPVTLLLVRFLDRRRFPMWLSVPAAWVGMEWVRSWMISGFAWYYLGHTQHRFLSVIQIADLGGVYLISALLAACNGLLFEMLYRWAKFRRMFRLQEPEISPQWEYGNWKPVALGTLLFASGLVGTIAYGFHRLDQNEFFTGPRVALLQGNIDQRVRNMVMDPLEAEKAGHAIASDYRQLYPLAYDYFKKDRERMPELVIWPETSFPGSWAELNPNLTMEEIRQKQPAYLDNVDVLSDVLRYLVDPRGVIMDRKARKGAKVPFFYSCPTNHLLGMNAVLLDDEGQEVQYNSAILIDKKGEKLDRYDKIHPVPFGEYIPFRKRFPFMAIFSPYGKDWPGIEAGTKLTRMQLHVPAYRSKEPFPFSFGVLICYEDTDPTLARNYGRQHEDGAPVHFLVNMSNDGWFDGTSEHEEHLAISRFRAIESRRSVVRSVNMGISAVIDSNGRILRPVEVPHQVQTEKYEKNQARLWVVKHNENGEVDELPVSEWSSFKKVDGVIHATVPIDRRESLYAHWGDWVPGLCWGLIGLVAIFAVGKRFLRRKDVRPLPV